MSDFDYHNVPEVLGAMGYYPDELHEFMWRQTMRQRWPQRILKKRGGFAEYERRVAAHFVGDIGFVRAVMGRGSIIAQNFFRDEERYRSTLGDFIIAHVVLDEQLPVGQLYADRDYERGELHDRLLYWCRELEFRTIPGSWSRRIRQWEKAKPVKQPMQLWTPGSFMDQLRRTQYKQLTHFQQEFQGMYIGSGVNTGRTTTQASMRGLPTMTEAEWE